MDRLGKVLEELRTVERELADEGKGMLADRVMKARWELVNVKTEMI